MDIFETFFAEGKSKAGHHITLTNGPAERGGWPVATCTCGWYSTNKDIDVVQEDIDSHTEWKMQK